MPVGTDHPAVRPEALEPDPDARPAGDQRLRRAVFGTALTGGLAMLLSVLAATGAPAALIQLAIGGVMAWRLRRLWSGVPSPDAWWDIPVRDRAPLIAAFIPVLLAGLAILTYGWTRNLGVAIMGIALLPVGSGLLLTVYAWRRRVPCPPSCGACGYPVDPHGPSAVCPECGRPLLGCVIATETRRWRMFAAPAGVVHRRRERSPAGIACGAALLGGGLIFLGPTVFAPDRAVGWLPTPVLVPLGLSDGEFWPAVERRFAGAREPTALAEEIVARREAGHPQHLQAWRWVLDRAAAGQLPPDVADRVFAEAFDVKLRVEAHPEGRMAVVRVSGDSGASPVRLGCFFGGFEVDGGETTLRSDALHLIDRRAAGAEAAASMILPREARSVRARVVLAAIRGAPTGHETITWRDDGTYALPAGVAWSREIVLDARALGGER